MVILLYAKKKNCDRQRIALKKKKIYNETPGHHAWKMMINKRECYCIKKNDFMRPPLPINHLSSFAATVIH